MPERTWRVSYYFLDARNAGLRWRDDDHPAGRSVGRWCEETYETEAEARRAAQECDLDENCSDVEVTACPDPVGRAT